MSMMGLTPRPGTAVLPTCSRASRYDPILFPDEVRLGLEEEWPLGVLRHDADGRLGHDAAGSGMRGRSLGLGMGCYPES